MHVSPDEEAVAQARRRRRAVPNPSINQIAWSMDDRLVCTVPRWHCVLSGPRILCTEAFEHFEHHCLDDCSWKSCHGQIS